MENIITWIAEQEEDLLSFATKVEFPRESGDPFIVEENMKLPKPILLQRVDESDENAIRNAITKYAQSITVTGPNGQSTRSFFRQEHCAFDINNDGIIASATSRSLCSHRVKHKRKDKHSTASDSSAPTTSTPSSSMSLPADSFLRNVKVGYHLDDQQRKIVSMYKDDLAACVGAGRVRGSNYTKAVTVLKKFVMPRFLREEHLTIKQLVKLLNKLDPSAQTPRKNTTKATLIKRVREAKRNGATVNTNMRTKAECILKDMPDEKRNELKACVNRIMFRDLTMGPSNLPQFKRGQEAEEAIFTRMKTDGVQIQNPDTLRTETAKLTNCNDQTLLIACDNPALATRCDITADAFFPSTQKTYKINIEIKHTYKHSNIKTFEQLPKVWRDQCLAQVRSSGALHHPSYIHYIALGDANTDTQSQWGKTCKITMFQMKFRKDELTLIDEDTRMMQELSRLLDPSRFEVSLCEVPDLPKVMAEQDGIRRGYSQRFASDCGATHGTVKYIHKDIFFSAGVRRQIKKEHIPESGLYLVGEVTVDHSATSTRRP